MERSLLRCARSYCGFMAFLSRQFGKESPICMYNTDPPRVSVLYMMYKFTVHGLSQRWATVEAFGRALRVLLEYTAF